MSRILISAPPDANPRAPLSCAARCLVAAGSGTDDVGSAYLFDGVRDQASDGPTLPSGAVKAAAGIVLPVQGVARASALLASGARRVLLGEAALADSSIMPALAAKFGAERIGVYVPARRLEVSWSFDTVSNADFSVLTPSIGAPAWEVLRADGSRTGTQALWWIGEMIKLGAAEVLLRVDVRDDADLNLCADCIERFADRVWIGPLADAAPALDEWVHYGHARQLALPSARYAQALAESAQLAAAHAAAVAERVA